MRFVQVALVPKLVQCAEKEARSKRLVQTAGVYPTPVGHQPWVYHPRPTHAVPHTCTLPQSLHRWVHEPSSVELPGSQLSYS